MLSKNMFQRECHKPTLQPLDVLSWGWVLATAVFTLFLYIYEFRGTPMIISLLAGVAVVFRYVLSRKNHSLLPVTVMLVVLAAGTYAMQVHPRLSKFITHKRVASYHYFLGSKYFKELGYYGLYRYTLLADRESTVPLLWNVKEIRHLEDLTRMSAQHAVDKAGKEKHHYFSRERWREFKRDWRPMARGSATWERKLNDHGFNPPPFWNLIPGLVAQHVHTSDATLYMAVRLFDLGMFLMLLCIVAYISGLDNALLCYLFVNAAVVLYYPHGFVDTYFQYQWLNALILTMIFFRSGKMKLAGVSLAYAAMVRIFPFVLIVGPAAVWFRKLIHQRSLPEKETAFLAAFSIACVVFFAIGLTQGKGIESTKEFVGNITFHADAIKFDSNKFGLKRLMSVDFTRPFERVKKEDREIHFSNNRMAYYLFWMLLVGLTLTAMYMHCDKDAWVIPLGTGLIFALMTASRYYYLMMLVFFITNRDKKDAGFAALSAAAIFLAHGIYIVYRGGGYGGFTLGNICFLIAFLVFPLSLLVNKLVAMKHRVIS